MSVDLLVWDDRWQLREYVLNQLSTLGDECLNLWRLASGTIDGVSDLVEEMSSLTADSPRPSTLSMALYAACRLMEE